jgi:hypothetical protein
LDFAHRLYFNKITSFRKLDLLPSSGKKVSHGKGRTQIEGVLEQGAEDNIWTFERLSDRRLEKTA